MNVSGIFIIDNGVMHATDIQNTSILRRSAPLYRSLYSFQYSSNETRRNLSIHRRGLLVTFRDTESEFYQSDSHSRRLHK